MYRGSEFREYNEVATTSTRVSVLPQKSWKTFGNNEAEITQPATKVKEESIIKTDKTEIPVFSFFDEDIL